MKKLWIALLSATIIFAIAMPASAVDVKFSGTYHVWGVFDKNKSLLDNENYVNANLITAIYGAGGSNLLGSQAFFQQRFRLQTEFKVVEGLTLVTRMDALEKKWGDRRWTGSTNSATLDSTSRNSLGSADTKAQENVEFERVYVDFNTGIGKFMVGYQNFIAFGTLFGDTYGTRPGIKWILPVGPVTLIAAFEKDTEGQAGRPTGPLPYAAGGAAGNSIDTDKDVYDLGFVYKWQGGDAGLMLQYGRNATLRAPGSGIGVASALQTGLVFDPYFRATFGPVSLEGEAAYLMGDVKWDNPMPYPVTDVKLEGLGLYLGARADFQPVYFGLQFAWIRGDDPSTGDKQEGGVMEQLLAGQAYNPALMMFNDDFHTWVGANGVMNYRGALPAAPAKYKYVTDTFLDNVWFYHLYVGVKPVPKADIKMAFTYAYADKKPWVTPATWGTSALGNPATEFNSNKYGYELDLTASYKIYDNLEYMVGAGYYWPGDYFKGCYNSTVVGCYNYEPALANDYLLMHKLTLSF